MADTIFTETLNADSDGWNGFTVINLWLAAALTLPSGTITRVRATFEASAAEGWTITNAYIGHGAGSGDAYDFAATPVQLLWSAAGSKAISAGATAVTDWAEFVYDKTSPLIIAHYSAGGAGVDRIRYKTGISDFGSYFKAANDAATVNKSGYSGPNTDLLGIRLIEVEVGGAQIILWG